MTRLRFLGFLGFTVTLFLILGTLFLFADVNRIFRFHEPVRERPVTAQALAIREQRAADEALLRSHSWVDREGGIIRVPIEDAMMLVVQGGAARMLGAEEPAPVPAAPAVPVAQERYSIAVGRDALPEGTNTITVRFIGADGQVTTTSLSMPAAIESLSVSATASEAGQAEPGAAPAEPADFDWQALGEQAYNTNCASCHQPTGQGIPGAFPPLAGHAPELYLASRSLPIDILLYGLQGQIQVHGQSYNGMMPAFNYLNDEQIASVLNFVMTAWDNEAMLSDFEPYQPGEVEAERGRGLSPTDVLQLRQEAGLE